MHRVLVFGREGQVSSALSNLMPDAQFTARDTCDLERPEDIERELNQHRPRVVINPAAYTAVDAAESDRDRALRVNAEAPGVMARWCKRHAASLIHFSTDYVYPGTGREPWTELDATGPLNVYGESKLEGERAIEACGGHHLILRTSWVYDAFGQNFVRTMLRLGREREELQIVDDQIGAPTYALDLAVATLKILTHPQFLRSSGRFNIANVGQTSWFEFARVIFARWRALGQSLKVESVRAISSAEYPTPARRPQNSRLNTDKLDRQFGIRLRPWDEALVAALEQLKVEARAEASSALI